MSQSIKSDHISESTVARIAGNILGHLLGRNSQDLFDGMRGEWTDEPSKRQIEMAVEAARAIAAEVKRTALAALGEPKE